jgi:hypothetical protein
MDRVVLLITLFILVQGIKVVQFVKRNSCAILRNRVFLHLLDHAEMAAANDAI